MILWFYNILSKTKSPSTLNRKGRMSKPELYHTPQQLSQYDCPIKIFSHKHKYMYMEQTLWNLLSQRCYKQVTFQNFNRSVVLVHFRLHKSMSKYQTCTKKMRGTIKLVFSTSRGFVCFHFCFSLSNKIGTRISVWEISQA